MKKLLVLAVVSLVFVGSAYASRYEDDPCKSRFFGKILNECSLDSDNQNDKNSTPVGVGADILLVETKHVDVVGEYRYDYANDEHSGFTVFKTKRSVWSMVKSLFKKGE